MVNIWPGAFVQLTTLSCFWGLMVPALSHQGASCLRWNCPCAGEPPQAEKRSLMLSRTAHDTRRLTQGLLQNLRNQRFGGNSGHVDSLRRCVDYRNQRCMRTHLHWTCDMGGLPLLRRVADTGSKISEVPVYLEEVRRLLAEIAIFVEQARLDEDTRAVDTTDSMGALVRQIEEQGIYHILCHLHTKMGLTSHDVPTAPIRTHMDSDCRDFNDTARRDNRNFMVFTTLEKLLEKLGEQFEYFEATNPEAW